MSEITEKTHQKKTSNTRARSYLKFGIYSYEEKRGRTEKKYPRIKWMWAFFKKRIGDHKDWDIKQSKFTAIMKDINDEVLDLIVKHPGVYVNLPCNMGELCVRTKVRKMFNVIGRLNNRLPIDRERTYELWNSNPEAKEKKTVIHILDPNRHMYYWNKERCIVRNRGHYHFIMVVNATNKLRKHVLAMNRDIIYPILGEYSKEAIAFNKEVVKSF